MKKIGIIGGLGPESTIDYYKGIYHAFKESYEETGFPEIVIESLNLKEFTSFAERNEWDKIANFITEACNRLYDSGAQFGAIASNTPHKVFDKIQSKTKLPLISIVEATFEYSKGKNFRRLGLLGTKFTMESQFYQNVFEKANIRLYVPTREEQDYIQEKLLTEIEFSIIKEKTKKKFVNIVKRIKSECEIEGLILGCTELPLIIEERDIGIEYINTTQIHINSIVNYCKERE